MTVTHFAIFINKWTYFAIFENTSNNKVKYTLDVYYLYLVPILLPFFICSSHFVTIFLFEFYFYLDIEILKR